MIISKKNIEWCMNLLTTKKSGLIGSKIPGRYLNSSPCTDPCCFPVSGAAKTYLVYAWSMSLRLTSCTILTKLINTLMMLTLISLLVVTTSNASSWFKIVGRNVIRVVDCMACKAFKILQVSLSTGTDVGFKLKSLSARENKLKRCWSCVLTVE